jgi:rhodanese-related sulfurtransferase
MSETTTMPPLKKGFCQLVQEAEAQVKCITPQEAKALLGSSDILFVDLRGVKEINENGVIDGAFHCPRGMLEFWIDPTSQYHKPELTSGKTLLLFCASGGRSALAAKTLKEMGFDSVMNMTGGFKDWKELK